MRRDSDILIKTHTPGLKVGEIYIFVGLVSELNKDILLLDGSLNKMTGTAHLWDNYIKLLETFQNSTSIIPETLPT